MLDPQFIKDQETQHNNLDRKTFTTYSRGFKQASSAEVTLQETEKDLQNASTALMSFSSKEQEYQND